MNLNVFLLPRKETERDIFRFSTAAENAAPETQSPGRRWLLRVAIFRSKVVS